MKAICLQMFLLLFWDEDYALLTFLFTQHLAHTALHSQQKLGDKFVFFSKSI